MIIEKSEEANNCIETQNDWDDYESNCYSNNNRLGIEWKGIFLKYSLVRSMYLYLTDSHIIIFCLNYNYKVKAENING